MLESSISTQKAISLQDVAGPVFVTLCASLFVSPLPYENDFIVLLQNCFRLKRKCLTEKRDEDSIIETVHEAVQKTKKGMMWYKSHRASDTVLLISKDVHARKF